LAGQFAEIWEMLGRPDDFVIVEQGAHHGEFASDVLGALCEQNPEFFATVCYRIVEPFAVLRQRQQGVLRPFRERTEWAESLETMESFCGVHFSNELVDAMPVHLIVATGEERRWRERLVEQTSWGFIFVDRPITDPRLRARLAKIPPAPLEGYKTEINLAALDWIEVLAGKLRRGVVLIADYGLSRPEFYAPSRRTGTLRSYANHRVLPSLLENIGQCDLTTHVEWTSLAEYAEQCGLTIGGFTDQHHFLTGLLSSHPDLAAAGAKKNRALQTLIHPEFLGMKFQFLGLTKGFPGNNSLGGFKFACDARVALELD
jgi:SAM-dependent MidA family methyltransferase